MPDIVDVHALVVIDAIKRAPIPEISEGGLSREKVDNALGQLILLARAGLKAEAARRDSEMVAELDDGKVACTVDGCGRRVMNLKRHLSRQHPGYRPK